MLRNCCMCISLRTGAIIIAVLSTLGSFIGLGVGIYSSIHGNFLGNETEAAGMMYYGITLVVTTNLSGQPLDPGDDFYYTAKVMIPFELLQAAVRVVFCYGIIKKIPKLFLPWMICSCSWMVVGFMSIVLIMIVDPFALVYLLGVLIQFYIIYVVWSHYHELKHNQKQDQRTTDPRQIAVKY